MEAVLAAAENQVLGIFLYIFSILKTMDLKIVPSHSKDEGSEANTPKFTRFVNSEVNFKSVPEPKLYLVS